jgi:23S rRNA (adenine2503-C2)-methyltransferase
MYTEVARKDFSNGTVYALRTPDGYVVEVTDTFLPYYTKNAVGTHQNALVSTDLGSRAERWMIGVSTMSGCPVRCKFCATGQLRKSRLLTGDEIIEQIAYVMKNRPEEFRNAQEHKINYTRMGEPFLNIDAVREAMSWVDYYHTGTHHYISTIGLKNADYSWISGNVTLQLSVHSLREDKRNWLIPFKNKATLAELGQIRTRSNLKTTLNMTLVDEDDFDIIELKKLFDRDHFFIKLSPINRNCMSDQNGMGGGVIQLVNIR